MVHEFGPFRYDAAQRLLFRGAEPVPLVPKAIDTLHALLDRRGQVVEKAELMKLVWPDTTVEEIGLARNISTLRSAIGDEFIETIPKRGYRFVPATPAPASVPAAPRRWWIIAALAVVALLVYWQFYWPSRYLPPGHASVGVLPFEALTPTDPNEPRALQERLTAALAANPGLLVTSPSTIARYQALRVPSNWIARILGWDAILEGSFTRAEGRLRVTVRLADVHSGKLIWAGDFDPEAVPEIASQVRARLSATR